MLRAICRFLKHRDLGQDLAEYCLITALIVLIALAIIWHFSGGMQGMWNSADSALAASGSNSVSAAPSSAQASAGL